MFVILFRDWVIARTSPRIATQDPFECQPPSPEKPVFLQGFYGIMGTSGSVSAGRRSYRRNIPLITANKPY
jgi:hypothetical protein